MNQEEWIYNETKDIWQKILLCKSGAECFMLIAEKESCISHVIYFQLVQKLKEGLIDISVDGPLNHSN